MSVVKAGDTVTIEFEGKFEDGTIFETSLISGPLMVTLGEGKLLPDLEKALMGMRKGEKKTVLVPEERAYGKRRRGLILEISKDRLPGDLFPEAGMKFLVRQKDSRLPTQIEVLSVSENTITVDANHPLAGHALHFDLKVVQIQEKGKQ